MTARRAPASQLDWQRLVARSGQEGHAWTEEFQREEHRSLAEGTSAALTLLRRRQHQPARDMLAAIGARLGALHGTRPSILHALGRLYHGVLAYHHYCVELFDAAKEELRNAEQCVRAALDADRVLLPLAHDCHEFHLHQARIARNQGRWDEMQHIIEGVRAMIENRRPLCTLSDGITVDYATLEQHYRALALDADEQQAVQPLLEVELRRRHLESFLLQLYVLPGFVIAYA